MRNLGQLLGTAIKHPLAPPLEEMAIAEFAADFINLLPLLEVVFGVDFLQSNPLFCFTYQSALGALPHAAVIEKTAKDWRQFVNGHQFPAHGSEPYEELLKAGYEHYFAIAKPRERKKNGVWYTPNPIVSYQCRSVEALLLDKFDQPLGMASPDIDLIDPACGIGCYLTYCFRLAVKSDRNEARQRYCEGHFKGIDVDLMACYLARLNMEFAYYQEFKKLAPYRGIRCGNALERQLWN